MKGGGGVLCGEEVGCCEGRKWGVVRRGGGLL